jgi:hypothetical protein
MDGIVMKRRFHSALRLTLCYVGGIVLGILILLPWLGFPLIVFIPDGMILAFPLFLVALLVLLIFHDHIQSHLLAWCLVAPVSVVIAWLAIEYGVVYSHRGYRLEQYLAIRNVLERAFLALLCVSAASVLFYVWNRKRPVIIGVRDET